MRMLNEVRAGTGDPMPIRAYRVTILSGLL